MLKIQALSFKYSYLLFFAVLTLLAIVAMLDASGQTQDHKQAQEPRNTSNAPLRSLKRIEGWVPYWTANETIVREASQAGFTDLLFFHGTVEESGEVKIELPSRLTKGVQAARKHNISTWLTVTNHGRSMKESLSDEGIAGHIDQLIQIWRSSGCQHLDLDYENIEHKELIAVKGAIAELVNDMRKLRPDARLSLTLQPADKYMRSWMLPTYKELLASPWVDTLRLMCYDFHWRTSLPGSLYPKWAFGRLLDALVEHRHKLGICLPLYGYDWSRPEDFSLPAAKVIQFSEVESLMQKPESKWAWARNESEIVGKYIASDGTQHFVAAPNARMIADRVSAILKAGIPNVAFWHLGCAKSTDVTQPCLCSNHYAYPMYAGSEIESWDTWLTPYKERVCIRIEATKADTFHTLSKRFGCSRPKLIRFNNTLTSGTVPGAIIYVPVQSR